MSTDPTAARARRTASTTGMSAGAPITTRSALVGTEQLRGLPAAGRLGHDLDRGSTPSDPSRVARPSRTSASSSTTTARVTVLQLPPWP